MDKGFMKYLKGRRSIAVALLACLMIVALPAVALAAPMFAGAYPGSTTIGGQPGQIGIQVTGSSTTLVSGQIFIDGSPQRAFLTPTGVTKGHWTPEYTAAGSGTYTVVWTWTPAGLLPGGVVLYAYPATTLSVGSHTVTAAVTDALNVTTTDGAGYVFGISGTPLPPTPPSTGAATAGCAAGCHQVDGQDVMWSARRGMSANCAACHTNIDAPPHGFFTGANTHADLADMMAQDTNTSYACGRCHGTDFTAIALVSSEHVGCSCHGYNLATDSVTGCASCHKTGTHGPIHAFQNAAGAGFPKNVSGHNTTTYGTIGAYTKFDGSGSNPLLTWTASMNFTVSTAKSANAVSVAPGTSFTSGQTGIVSSTWDFPTTAVFWPASDNTADSGKYYQPAPTGVTRGLTSASVITCQDCHTGLSAAGPHGAAQNWGLDPNFQGAYSLAGLTKQTTAPLQYYSSGAMAASTWNGFSASGIMSLDPALAGTGSTTAGMATLKATWGNKTNWKGDQSTSTAVICAKCHRLEVVLPGGTGLGTSGVAGASVEGANTAHDSHHQDATDASSQCVNCHVAIPHGWQQPRLLVDKPKFEGTEFVSEDAMETEGMGTLAGLNNHPIVPSTGIQQYSTGSGTDYATTALATNQGHAGTVLWDESQCDACGDHYGNTWKQSPPFVDSNHTDMGVPVRIDTQVLP